MTQEDSRTDTPDRKRRLPLRWVGAAGLVWAVIVMIALVWQSRTYTGIMATLAEWQFREFDRFFPVATIAVLTAALTLPFSLILAIRLFRRGKRRDHGDETVKPQPRPRSQVAERFTAVLAIGAIASALVVLVVGFNAGVGSEKAQRISVDATLPADFEGPARMRGSLRLDRIAFYKERFVITGRDLWVAPLVSQDEAAPLHYFVQIRPQRPQAAETREVSGYLRKQAIPGGLARLYENAGYRVAPQAFVLFSDRRSALWPYYSAASDLAILALVAALLWSLLRRNRLRKG